MNDTLQKIRAQRKKLVPNPNGKNQIPRKRYAISPQFQRLATTIGKPTSPKEARMNIRALSPKLSETEGSSRTINVREILNKTYAKDTRQELESYLENHGGSYKPEFVDKNLFESLDNKTGWSRFLTIIKDNPNNEKVQSAIKNMKGQKKVYQTVYDNKHKELLLQNENILKFFLYNKLVSKQNTGLRK